MADVPGTIKRSYYVTEEILQTSLSNNLKITFVKRDGYIKYIRNPQAEQSVLTLFEQKNSWSHKLVNFMICVLSP